MKIIIVEDDKTIRENLHEILEAYDYEVHSYPDGLQGLKGIRAHMPDLVVCDIMLPQMDGYEILKKIKSEENTANIPFIFLTARAERADQRKGMELGADDYLIKPFTSQELLKAIDTRIQKQLNTATQIQSALYQKLNELAKINSHEYNTPLNGIMGLSEILKDNIDTLSKPEILEIAGAIQLSAKRLHRTFKNFILYILIQRGELKDHVSQVGSNWLHQFIKSTLTEKAYKFNRPDQFKLSSTIKDEFTISLAQDDFTHLVDELIRNAFKFSEFGTTVSVNISGNETGFTVSVSNQTSDANFFDQAEAFKQFNREQKEQQGSGLGLYLSKKIAEIHRWKLTGTYQENTVTLSLEVKA